MEEEREREREQRIFPSDNVEMASFPVNLAGEKKSWIDLMFQYVVWMLNGRQINFAAALLFLHRQFDSFSCRGFQRVVNVQLDLLS